MKKSTVLQKALWSNVLFAELSAVAFLFLNRMFPFIDELAGGQSFLLGLDMVLMAGLTTYAALRPATSRRLIQLIAGLNILLFGYYVEKLIWGPTVSVLATEVMLIDAVLVAALVIAQVMGLRAVSQKSEAVLTA